MKSRFYAALDFYMEKQPERHIITIFYQCKLVYGVILIHPQMTARRAIMRLFMW